MLFCQSPAGIEPSVLVNDLQARSMRCFASKKKKKKGCEVLNRQLVSGLFLPFQSMSSANFVSIVADLLVTSLTVTLLIWFLSLVEQPDLGSIWVSYFYFISFCYNGLIGVPKKVKIFSIFSYCCSYVLSNNQILTSSQVPRAVPCLPDLICSFSCDT